MPRLEGEGDLNLNLSSLERARANRIIASVDRLLRRAIVESILAKMNWGQITIDVVNGIAVQVTPSPQLRVGKELEPDDSDS